MPGDLQRGRASYRKRAWEDAYRLLSRADRAQPLATDDLERLGVSAYLLGRDDDFLKSLERAHHAHLDAAMKARAARCAFWIGLRLLLRGESGPASGWLGRAQRLVDGADCVERGYLALPEAEQRLGAGDLDAAATAASDALAIGERFEDVDLTAAARHLLGRILVRREQLEDGLAMLDEAMVAVTAGELSPIMTGLIYCSVIEACQSIYALERARDWTSALARWCESQPDMVAFTATCLVHRAEILELQGAWDEATTEAEKACERFAQASAREGPAAAYYRQGELHRLRGRFAAAEAAFRRASQSGREPQPGLALLRIAQGRPDAAVAAIARVEAATTDRSRRIEILPAYVEIMLAAGKTEEARRAAGELEAIADCFATRALEAIAAQVRGAVDLDRGDAASALGSLHRARRRWQTLEAPYAEARTRVLLAIACRDLGDADGAALELDAARAVFRQLGALPDLARIDSLSEPARAHAAHGLSARELEVLREVAAGKTNKAIAETLGISDKTVARHVSNIFDKLGLSSRAAATAYAYEHDLI